MHTQINPVILYWGSIIILITTTDEDGSPNIAPMSSSWFLGHRCMLGLDASSQTTKNLLRTKQCVLNLADESMGDAINALSHTTGTDPVRKRKLERGYRFVKDKFAVSGLTEMDSEVVGPKRVRECGVHMEAELVEVHEMMGDIPNLKGAILALEVKVLRVYVEEDLRMMGEGMENRIDGEKWRPMVMCFRDMYGLREGKVESKLATIREEMYPFNCSKPLLASRQNRDRRSLKTPYNYRLYTLT